MPIDFSRNIGSVYIQPTTSFSKIVVSYGINTIRYKKDVDANGGIWVNISEIAEALAECDNWPVDYQQQITIPLKTLYVQFESASGRLTTAYPATQLIIGGMFNSTLTSDEYAYNYFLSARPTISYTSLQSKEFISFANEQHQLVRVRMIMRGGSTLDRLLWTETDNEEVDALISIDCSLERVLEMFEDIEDEFVGYSIMLGDTQEFTFLICQDVPSVSFVFQNSLGGWDSIHALGKVTSIQTGETLTFINNNIEQEYNNKAVESWEVNTGYIQTNEEERFWKDFLRSKNRYVLLAGKFRQIVIDEYKANKDVGSLGSFTFKYHLSEQQFLLVR